MKCVELQIRNTTIQLCSVSQFNAVQRAARYDAGTFVSRNYLMEENRYHPGTATNYPEPERRTSEERRQPSLQGFLIGAAHSRRRSARRSETTGLYHTDWYDTKCLLIALLLFGLSCLDATLTIQLLNRGAIELNPVMDFLLRKEGNLFVVVKLTISAICVIILIAHHQHRLLNRFRIDYIMMTIIFSYIFLVRYEYQLLNLI